MVAARADASPRVRTAAGAQVEAVAGVAAGVAAPLPPRLPALAKARAVVAVPVPAPGEAHIGGDAVASLQAAGETADQGVGGPQDYEPRQ